MSLEYSSITKEQSEEIRIINANFGKDSSMAQIKTELCLAGRIVDSSRIREEWEGMSPLERDRLLGDMPY